MKNNESGSSTARYRSLFSQQAYSNLLKAFAFILIITRITLIVEFYTKHWDSMQVKHSWGHHFR